MAIDLSSQDLESLVAELAHDPEPEHSNQNPFAERIHASSAAAGEGGSNPHFHQRRMQSAGRPDPARNREATPEPTNSDAESMEQSDASQKRQLSKWRLIFSVFLPFAAGYFLSFLFRTINASISPALTSEFELPGGRR